MRVLALIVQSSLAGTGCWNMEGHFTGGEGAQACV